MTEQTIRLQIDGMSCASCVGRVEKALQAAGGVSAARVNLATKTARVSFDHDATDVRRVAQVATTAGYPARVVGGAVSPQQDTAALQRDFIIALVLSLPVVVASMGWHVFPSLAPVLDGQLSRAVQLVLTSLVLLWPGRGFFQKGVPALLRGAPDMDTLVAIGTGAAWGFSAVVVMMRGALPADGVYFEAAAMIVTLILLGRLLEARAKGRTGDAVRGLIGLQPRTATVIRDGVDVAVPVADLQVGDQIKIVPATRIAVDGIVTQGQSYVDEAMLTGEPAPQRKTVGDTVTGGTMNGAGALVFRATRVGADTALSQIVEMVQDAQDTRLPIQAVVTRITSVFVPIVLVLAAVTFAGWLMFGGIGFALVAGVSVLIVACPCAMGLATPMSIMVGTGRAAQAGVLFRSGDALQTLQSVAVIAFDKTGTLTQGKPVIARFDVNAGYDGDRVLGLIASLETQSEHPLGRAVVDAAATRGVALMPVSDVRAIAGMGIQGHVAGQLIKVGSARFIGCDPVDDASGGSVFYASVDDVQVAQIAVADQLRPSAKPMIAALRDMGIKVVMLTGDTAQTAHAVARDLGIDTVMADLLPAQKLGALRDLRTQGAVGFVGDGINDAPALADADVGIAIGTGTDIAIESADVVLMSHDLMAVVRGITLSRATLRNIKQNLFWAFAYNAALIPVAAGLLYPVWGVMLSPMLAAAAMTLSSVFVVTNALRLRGVAR